MWWWYDRRTPRRELGYAPPGSLAMPRFLAPEERFSMPEVLGEQSLVGAAGESAPVAQTPQVASPSESRGGRLPGGIPAGVVNIGISVAARAAGLPGIVASIINLIVGPAVRRAFSPSNPGDSAGYQNLDVARGPVGESGAEPPSIGGASLSDAIRSREGVDDEGGGLAMPGPTTTAVGEDQDLAPVLNTESLDVYGDGFSAVVDSPIDD